MTDDGMADVDNLIKKTYAAIVFGNSKAALCYLEKVQKAIENGDERKPTDKSDLTDDSPNIEKPYHPFRLSRFWLTLKPKFPTLLAFLH